jgi:hypothetical protein
MVSVEELQKATSNSTLQSPTKVATSTEIGTHVLSDHNDQKRLTDREEDRD